MILFLLICSLIVIAVLERLSRRQSGRRLYVSFSADMDLVEPGELVTLRYTVCNTGRLPVLCVGFALQFAEAVDVREDADWTARHVTPSFSGPRVDHHFYLLPRRRFSGKLRLSLKRRGVVDLGTCYLETGDLLGLHSAVSTRDIGVRIVCTAPRLPLEQPKTLGGFLGNVSVRRFIHEDPSMLIGYRDYTGREPMKQISWFQTAKAGHLTVRVNDHTVDRNVTLLVNMQAASPRVSERCLSLTRTVCELLEAGKVPYALRSNGDLQSLHEGLGRAHLHFILRRIGVSRLAGYRSFPALVDRCIAHRRGADSYIVVTPALSVAGEQALTRLQAYSDVKLCVLYAEEEPT